MEKTTLNKSLKMQIKRQIRKLMQSDVLKKWTMTVMKTSHLKVRIYYIVLNTTIHSIDEVQLAMEEIVDKEKDIKQLVQVTNMLYEKNIEF